ncbi:MAG: type I restriction enzyme M protein, partial [Vicingaceae bacterium]
FIYLRSENIISQKLLHDNDSKNALIQSMYKVDDAIAKEVFDVFRPSVDFLSDTSIRQVVDLLVSIDHAWLHENIATVFDETLERIALSQGRRGGEFIQPKELTEFINSYIGSTAGLRVYNPFAGVASFIKDYGKSSLTYAQELNKKTWAIGQLRLIAHQCVADYKCEDSISNWPSQTKFDLIISTPPFGLRLANQYAEQYPEFRTAESFLVGMSIDSLSQNGKLIAVLPHGILFRGGSEQRLRERLIQEDLIDTIISFPGGILHNTGIPFIVLILNKNKSFPGKIKLVDANSFIAKPTAREHNIEVKKLLREVENNQDSESLKIISNEDVIANNFNLNIPRYFQEEVEGTKLGDILSIYRGTRTDLPENGKLIRIRDLRDDKIDFQLAIDKVEDMPLNRPVLQRIEVSCLLLATRWKTLKPTFFHFENEPIYISFDILAFTVDESRADVAYVINELHADYVQQQLEGFRLGGTLLPLIRRDDLLEIKIKLPSIEEQRAKVAGLNEISDKIKQLQSERNALAHGINTKEFNEIASLKHTLGRPRQNILSWSKNLSKFFDREKENIAALNIEFKALFELGIFEALSEIKEDIQFISEVLERGTKGLILEEYEKVIVSLGEINSVINELSSNSLNFSISKQLLEGEGMKNRGVLINKPLLKTLIDNLLTNANKHGFKDQREGNLVKVEISEVKDLLIIDIRNNGLPFPKNFDKEKFTEKFSTADNSNGSGLGGYDINRIATYFDNSDWELILNEDLVYPVIFRFSLPIKTMN